MKKEHTTDFDIAVLGLGYVGLPLFLELSRHFTVRGYDPNIKRIEQLKHGVDATGEISKEHFSGVKNLKISNDPEELKTANTYIITVPTPVDKFNKPDLSQLKAASELVATYLKRNDVVIYESTVYPGTTEEICSRILEQKSGLSLNNDFFLGYSPERINPGANQPKLRDIVKVTSGSNAVAANLVDFIYSRVVSAGTFKAESIKVAEAAKVIENIQRDVNIALINEFAMLFEKLSINTSSVLEAARTKWNFLDFRPGLVGGHCIGVDPYYLTHKAQEVGFHPELILAGRRINDYMSKFVVTQLIKKISSREYFAKDPKVLILGFTFKENCSDVRNTKVFDIFSELQEYSLRVDVYDPVANSSEVKEQYGISLVPELIKQDYVGVILAVGHNQFKDISANFLRSLGQKGCVVYDLKGILNKAEVDISI